jgi:hypothetical protein
VVRILPKNARLSTIALLQERSRFGIEIVPFAPLRLRFFPILCGYQIKANQGESK